MPFEDDGLRNGEALRPWVTVRFQEALAAQRTPWLMVSGPREARIEQASRATDAALERAFRFG